MRFSGHIGFAQTTETSPGVWKSSYVEKPYTGMVIQNTLRWEVQETINPNAKVTNRISIIMDAYALINLGRIRYVSWNGTKWMVSSVEHKHPRLLITIGEVFNG